ncbi:MAG TPA: type II secretion system protein [Burkholderiaceae bacterium]|jgi:type IV pilus assembly protein PilE
MLSPIVTADSAARARGFTLIELMVVVTIVAILASVALPAYTSYVTRSKIPDATNRLAVLQNQMDSYILDHQKYSGAQACNTDTTTSPNFVFKCSSVSDTAYVLQAQGAGVMTGFTYTVDQNYNKATPAVPPGWTSSGTCWVTKKDGTC